MAQSKLICRPRLSENDFGPSVCRDGTFCGSPLNYTGIDPMMDDPWNDITIDYNTVNFNDLWGSMMLIFEALTLEGWSVSMRRQMSAGSGMLAIPFFLLMIIFGSFFVLNLNLAVIMANYSRYDQQTKEDLARKVQQE
jgi:hypothetical protein